MSEEKRFQFPVWAIKLAKVFGPAILLTLAPLLCGLISNPTGSALCGKAVVLLASVITEGASTVPLDALPDDPIADTRPACPSGDFCLSTGYALPLPDGGKCRCPQPATP